RLAAAAKAVEIATQAEAHTLPPDSFYAQPWAPGTTDCVCTFKKFYLDVGASTLQVGPLEPILPEDVYRGYAEGRLWLSGNSTGISTSGGSGGVESAPLWLGHTDSSAVTNGWLATLIPTQTMAGVPGYPASPDIVGSTNAVAAAGMDYV